VQVEAMDSFGNPATSFTGNVTLSDADGSGDLQGPTTEPFTGDSTNSTATITFNDLTLDYAGVYFFNATAPGVTGPTSSNPLTVTAASASQLVVPYLSTDIATGEPFTLQVTARDPNGNLDSTFKGKVTLALATNPGGATLGGNLSATAVGGLATFSGLSISKPGSGYTLQATSSGLAMGIGPAFDVAQDQLVVTTQPPSNVTAGSRFGLVVKAENGKGAVDTTFDGSVTLADASFLQTLGGTTTVTAAKGAATFSGLTIDQTGFLTWLTAQSNGLPAVSSNLVNLVPGTASQLAVSAAPSDVTIGAPFEVDVSVEDAFGNVQTAYSGNVTLALADNPGGAALGGTLTEPAVNGVAAFPGLTLDKTGSGYTLKATVSGLTSVTTPAVSVTPAGVATQLVVTTQPPSSVAAGSGFGLTVTAEDSSGTVDKTFDGSVTLSGPSGTSFGGTLTMTAVDGVATFTGLTDDQAASSITFAVTSSSGLDPATTDPFTVTPMAASQLVVWGPFGNALPGSPFGMTVFAEDQYGNVDPTVNGNVTLALQDNPGSATLGGTVMAPAVYGVANFPDLTLNTLGSGYTLQAAGAGLTGTSTPFDVTQDQLLVTSQPPASLSSGAGFGLTVEALGPSGKVDNTFTGNVTVALIDPTGTGATLGGTLTATATDGVAVFSGLTVNMAGFYLLSAAANGVGGATTEPVNVVGPASLSQSTITASPAEIALGGKTTVTLTARDANGNQEPGGGLTVAFTASGSAGTLSSVTDNHNGTYTATFTGTSPGSDTITATIGGDSNKVISTATVTVVGPYSLFQSTIAVSPSTVASGGTTTVTLTARDVNGNQELGGGLSVGFALLYGNDCRYEHDHRQDQGPGRHRDAAHGDRGPRRGQPVEVHDRGVAVQSRTGRHDHGDPDGPGRRRQRGTGRWPHGSLCAEKRYGPRQLRHGDQQW
jgi:hypothetical protein